MITIESIHVDLGDSSFASIKSASGERAWKNGDGDVVRVFHFDVPPDLTATLDDRLGLARIFREQAILANGGLVDLDVVPFSGARAIRVILKVPQTPSGITYLGVLTIPFRDRSFQIGVTARENGMTGMRDSIVFAMSGPELDRFGRPIGWASDPFDASVSHGVLRNQADDPDWDAQFPDHPLSRVRRLLATIESKGRLDPAVLEDAPFVTPARGRAWWRFWE